MYNEVTRYYEMLANSAIINHNTKRNYLKHNSICKFCGAKATTIDHIIPCQVFEMTMEFEEDFRSAIRDKSNWQPACKACNKRKRAAFTIKDIPTYLYNKYKDCIDKYIALRKQVLEIQNYKCAGCGKEVTEDTTVLRYKRNYNGERDNIHGMIVTCIEHETRN